MLLKLEIYLEEYNEPDYKIDPDGHIPYRLEWKDGLRRWFEKDALVGDVVAIHMFEVSNARED